MLNSLLIQLDFESYFIKLMCIQGHITLDSSARLVLRLAPQTLEAFALGVPCAF